MDQTTLLAAHPGDLAAAADAYQALMDALEARRAEWTQGTSERMRAAWQGHAAEQASPTILAVNGKLQAAVMELTVVRDALRQAAEVFVLERSAAQWAADNPAGGASADRPLAEAEQADRATAERLTRLAEAARTGQALKAGPAVAALLRSANPADGLDSLLAALLPAPGTPPDRVAAWWRTLGPDGQHELTSTHPDLIGNLDGLPARDRDRANRLALDRLLEHEDGLSEPLRGGLRAIRQRLAAESAGGADDVLLLGLSREGQGRGILSFGDPDTADDVAVYVPGFGTELAAVGRGDADRAQRVRSEASRYGEGRTTAAMVWLGYDAPPNEGIDPRSAQVADPARARAGAASYDRFLAGLKAARPAAPAHVTALGHSYGSLVVGLAAQQPGGIAADEVVLVGSPGTGAGRAAELGVGADHVYVGAADCDPVSRAPGKAGAAGGWLLGGPVGLAAETMRPHELWFGQDPASDAFGAHRFHVAPGNPGRAFASHSAYFDETPDGPSESLANIARIVADHPDQITPDHPR